jgi:branched-chain amino acid transport system substrate-binding protein
MTRRILLAAMAAMGLAGGAAAQVSDGVVRIGVLNDTTGVFQDTNGPGSAVAARMAAEDFNATAAGRGIRVEIVAADHQNRPDVGSAITRRWLDLEGVDAVVDVPNSAVGLAVNNIARGTRMTFLASSTATSDLTGSQCSPNTVQWVTDTWAIGRTAARAMMARGGNSWYFLTVDYALGHAIQRDASEFIQSNGGQVLGASRHPLGVADYSSFLQLAQRSRAQVIGLANASPDTGNAIRQAAEFRLTRNQRVVAFLMFVNDVHALGLGTAQGLLLMEAFYWDMDDGTRAFSRRFQERLGRVPSTNQAGVYSSTLAYLNAVARAGTDDARQVVPEMKRAPIQDPLFGETTIRQDGRAVHAMHLFEVKAPGESRGPWDYYRLVQTIPGDQAFRPLAEGGCALVR